LVILRGETIVSVSVEGPPPVGGDEKASLTAGPGRGMPAGRGMGLGAGEWGYMCPYSNLSLAGRALMPGLGADLLLRRTRYGCSTYGIRSTTSWFPSGNAWITSGYASWLPRWSSSGNASSCWVS